MMISTGQFPKTLQGPAKKARKGMAPPVKQKKKK